MGATFAKPCTGDHDLWTCDLALPGGGQRRIVWNASRSYDTQLAWKYPVAAAFTRFRDLNGNESPIGGGSVTIGSKPILLETSDPHGPKN
jgi:hypothetical protein